jgi:hypothetical protein
MCSLGIRRQRTENRKKVKRPEPIHELTELVNGSEIELTIRYHNFSRAI